VRGEGRGGRGERVGRSGRGGRGRRRGKGNKAGKGWWRGRNPTLRLILRDVSVAAGDHVVLSLRYPTNVVQK
jgi:hypothetical protein